MSIRVLIVDDEPWACKRIAGLLKDEPSIEIVGECADGEDAIARITELSPDLVFLDVQMPGVDGFDVIEAVGPEKMPLVIFATAYDKYALRAFDAHAVDYLLKPFDEDRFQRALARARKELQGGALAAQGSLRTLLDALRSERKYLQRLVVKSGGRVLFLKATEVDWFEAAGNYITLHVGKDEYLLRETMNGLEPKLNPDQFVRIHRSTIVNLDRVKEMHPWFQGEQVVMLKDGKQLTVGRAFRDRLRRFLDNVAE
ncbi:MAG: LytTR family DNA-binding domain-containing protein [Acidobacteriota bacterium]